MKYNDILNGRGDSAMAIFRIPKKHMRKRSLAAIVLRLNEYKMATLTHPVKCTELRQNILRDIEKTVGASHKRLTTRVF